MTVLVTSATRASAEVLATRLCPGVLHQFAPVDSPDAVRRFLDHWRPDLGVLVESELWPNLILAARRRGARMALVSARMSARSLAGWRRAPAAARALLGAFDLILARDAAAAERLARLGARVEGLADLKFGAAPLPADPATVAEVREALAGRPVLLAASTHPGEEALILEAFRAARLGPRAVLILAPRHPGRGEAIERMAHGLGFAAGRRSAGARPGEAAVLVADTLGELGLWYRLASLAVVGGSLIPGGPGGHNPLEPARLGCPFIAGPLVPAWPVYQALEAVSATALATPADLAAWLAKGAEGDSDLPAMAARARDFAAAGDAAARQAVDRVVELARA
jgi:3-deoxy-D-manno-octulosonic-acid transferase